MQDSFSKAEEEEGYTEVFAWGADRYGQLGLGNKQSGRCYCVPRFCSFNVRIRMVACGEQHSAFITGKGQIFTVGSNSDGRLGLGDRSMLQSTTPCLVEALSRFNAVNIACGWGHTAAVIENGDVYTWGMGEYGALGVSEPESQWFPVKVNFPDSQKALIISASCGTRHTAFVDSKGHLFACGSGDAGQLGTGAREKELTPCLVTTITERIQQVACGIFHSIILTVDGEVYATGGNNFGQLGTGTKRSTAIPVKVKGLDKEKVIKVSAGNHSACLSDNGELFIWGTGAFGEFLVPTSMNKVGNLSNHFTEISIGGTFGGAIDVAGNIYSWGSNINGELGSGDFESRILPKIITSLKGKSVSLVACGGSYAIALGRTITAPKIASPSAGIKFKEEASLEGSRKFYTTTGKTPTKSPMRPTDQIQKLKDELLEAIKTEQDKTQQLKYEFQKLEEDRTKLLRKETESNLDYYTENPTHREYVYSKEKEYSQEKEKTMELITELNELQGRIKSLENERRTLEAKVDTLTREKLLHKDEHFKLLEVLAAEEAGEKTKISEILQENEEKISREIENKNRLLNDKNREIFGLKDNIEKLKKIGNETEQEKIEIEEYYKEEIKKLEDYLEDIEKQIKKVEQLRNDLLVLHSNKLENIEELKKTIDDLLYQKTELLKNVDKIQGMIQELNCIFKERQKNLKDNINKYEKVIESIIKKEEEIHNGQVTSADEQASRLEEIEKLKRALNDQNYENEDMQNHINVKQIEIDKLNKDALAWGKVADNVRVENAELSKIVDILNTKNQKLNDTLNGFIAKEEKENKEKAIAAIRKSQSPLTIRSIVTGNKQTDAVKESKLEPSVLPSFAQENSDAGRLIESGDIIKDPYENLRKSEESPMIEGQFITPIKQEPSVSNEEVPLRPSDLINKEGPTAITVIVYINKENRETCKVV